MLSLRDVHVHIGKLHILQGVSLEVKEGECAALLGRNGVGKTTTLRSIMGLVARSHGVIEFDGDDLSKSPPHLIPRKGIGYVPQGRGIFPTLSVLKRYRGETDDGIPFGVYATVETPGDAHVGDEVVVLTA